ncbi:MAG: PEGA domain-containing protein [Candidatus Aminicenantaceae bacterium]
MILHPKARSILALVMASAFLFQGCATISSNWGQKIPVTSSPMGAKIFVDGKEKGETPMELVLKRKQNHLIRIELEGYDPYEISIGQKKSPWKSIIGNLIVGGLPFAMVAERVWGEAVSEDKPLAGKYFWYGFIVGFAAFMIVDLATGSMNYLSPKKVVVDLTKVGEEPRTRTLYLDADQLKNITWISIRCADSDNQVTLNLR